ncbi:MAG: hypothetical protein HY319_06775 [Armatimonadetes bacterium]|nr:hypothetical protein [Armatimonadota bacterium]
MTPEPISLDRVSVQSCAVAAAPPSKTEEPPLPPVGNPPSGARGFYEGPGGVLVMELPGRESPPFQAGGEPPGPSLPPALVQEANRALSRWYGLPDSGGYPIGLDDRFRNATIEQLLEGPEGFDRLLQLALNSQTFVDLAVGDQACERASSVGMTEAEYSAVTGLNSCVRAVGEHLGWRLFKAG